MPSVSIQFHALPEEMAAYAEACSLGRGLFTTEILFPFALRPLPRGALRARFVESPKELPNPLAHKQWELAFTLKQPDALLADEEEFTVRHEPIIMQVGTLTAAGLEESGLSAATMGPRVYAVAKWMAGRLRRMTSTKGVLGVQRDSGIIVDYSGYYYRYTPGAKMLSDRGVECLTLSPAVYLRLGVDDAAVSAVSAAQPRPRNPPGNTLR